MSNKLTDTAIVIENHDWKIRIYLGLAGLVTLVILGFMYRLEVGLIVLAIGGATAARIALVAHHRHKLAQFERRRLEAEVSKAEAEAVKAKAESFFVEKNAGVFVLDGIAVAAFYPAVSASKLLADIPQLALPEPSPPIKRLLDVSWPHLLILGPTRSGKTTIANHLIDNAEPDAIIYALDPHATQNARKGLPWSTRAKVIGDGRDWEAIDAMLVSLLGEMDQRFKPGSTALSPIYVANDEWLAVLKNCAHAKEFFETIGSEAAKVNMHLMIATQAATVDDLGCSAAVRDNLVELRLDHALKAQNRGELRWGKRRDSIEQVELPGPYRRGAMLPAPINVPRWDFDPIDLDAGPVPAVDPTELKIFELYQEGKSLRAIYAEVYGKPYTGGRQVAELRGILAKFGVIFDVSE